MVLECDHKAKEKRTKCTRYTRCDHGPSVGNAGLKCEKETLEK